MRGCGVTAGKFARVLQYFCAVSVNTLKTYLSAMLAKNLLLPFIFFSIFVSSRVLAQLDNNRWYFGHYAIIDFRNPIYPVSDTGSQMHSYAGCASVANSTTGLTLFYSNGLKVWNAQNQVMPHGDGLMGAPTTYATQGVAILAYPGKDSTYFLFTTDESSNNGANGLRYSIIDMRLDSGRGDVVPTQKNILVADATGEHLEIAQGRYAPYYWVVAHKRNSSNFLAFRVDSLGLHTTPVVSSVGAIHNAASLADSDANIGQMKFNGYCTQLAVALHGQNKIEIFNFDNSTGRVSNPTAITTPEPPYGLEFSGDGSKLYYTLARGIYQLDMNMPLSDLQLSVMPIGYSHPGYPFGDMQIAPNGKIYIAVNNATWLSALADPPQPGAACGFTDTAIIISNSALTQPFSHMGLPHVFIRLPINGTAPGYDSSYVLKDSCNSDTLEFSLNNINNVSSITWNFDDPDSYNNYAFGNVVTHKFIYAGRYRVSAVIHTPYFDDTVARYVNVVICDSGEHSPDCKFYTADAFTPNGDGHNDEFRPYLSCPTDYYNYRVYNRWGEMIFFTQSPRDKWDGNYLGLPCELGVYYWVAQYQFTGWLPVTRVGQVTLIR